jgi:hypothetical protein
MSEFNEIIKAETKTLAPVNANVAAQNTRVMQEVQAQVLMAKQFPRNQPQAYQNIIDACKRKSFADKATYAYPRAGKTIKGPSIRLAESLAQNWGNIHFGVEEITRNDKEHYSECKAFCWDIETNTYNFQNFTVKHYREVGGSKQLLTSDRDIYELVANMGSRRLRSRILATIPSDVIEDALKQCDLTLNDPKNVKPMKDRIQAAIEAFKEINVSQKDLEAHLKHELKVDLCTNREMTDLISVFNSIKSGELKKADFFGVTSSSENDDKKLGLEQELKDKAAAKATVDAAKKAKAEKAKAKEEPKKDNVAELHPPQNQVKEPEKETTPPQTETVSEPPEIEAVVEMDDEEPPMLD